MPTGPGHEARITLRRAASTAPSRFPALIEGIDGDTVRMLTAKGAALRVPFANIASAKLLLTDKLINATAPLSTEGADTIKTGED